MAEIFGVKIFEGKKEDLFRLCQKFIKEDKPHFLISLNPEILMLGEKDPGFKKILLASEVNFADGIGILWAAGVKNPFQGILRLIFGFFWRKILLNPIPEQIRGREFIFEIARLASENHLKIYLVGGRGTAQKAKEQLKAKIDKNLSIIAEDGPQNWQFQSQEDKDLVERIQKSQAEIVLSAFGAPKDELFLYGHKKELGAKLLLGVGGTFDYLAGKQKLPPNFLANLGLEWLWRLLHQPRRLKRQLALPRFILKVLLSRS
jgi:N-acetylglucosaminyldiphosphoundecaprenol N-acetyl-beta-D-mannosaminyltransferase